MLYLSDLNLRAQISLKEGLNSPDFNYLVKVYEATKQMRSEVVCDSFPHRDEALYQHAKSTPMIDSPFSPQGFSVLVIIFLGYFPSQS